MSKSSVGEYQGNRIFTIEQEATYKSGEPYTMRVSFGVKKAMMILEHIEALKQFVREQE